MSTTALLVAGGEEPPPEVFAELSSFDVVICVDRGLDYAVKNELKVDLCIGDFDSVTDEALHRIDPEVEIHRFPSDKDETDLELALRLALDKGCTSAWVIGIGGGELDHWLGNYAILANPVYRSLQVRAIDADALVTVAHGSSPYDETPARYQIHGQAGEHVSLLAVFGPAGPLTLDGFQYALDGELLAAGVGRGLRNVLVREQGTLLIENGTVLVIQPLWRRHSAQRIGPDG